MPIAPARLELDHRHQLPSQPQQHRRAKLRERHCQDSGDTSANMGRNKNQEDWGRDVYIR